MTEDVIPSGKKFCLPMQKMQETLFRSLVQEDLLEEGMATQSSILARRIQWIEDPGGPWSMRSQSQTRLSMHITLH